MCRGSGAIAASLRSAPPRSSREAGPCASQFAAIAERRLIGGSDRLQRVEFSTCERFDDQRRSSRLALVWFWPGLALSSRPRLVQPVVQCPTSSCSSPSPTSSCSSPTSSCSSPTSSCSSPTSSCSRSTSSCVRARPRPVRARPRPVPALRCPSPATFRCPSPTSVRRARSGGSHSGWRHTEFGTERGSGADEVHVRPVG